LRRASKTSASSRTTPRATRRPTSSSPSSPCSRPSATAPQGLTSEDVIEGGDEDELLTLSSVHQAKGLEWRAVFILWAADGKFPSPRSLRDTEGEEEERRLWYVALTRAQDQLYITYPLMVTDYSSRQTVLQRPSRFVTEVPPDLYEIWSLEEEATPPALKAPEEGGESGEPGGYVN
jgi:DNA helicase II / ATP-dependent DNA helicase PcrA